MGIALIYALAIVGPDRTTLIVEAAAGCAMSISLGLTASWWSPMVRARKPVMVLYTIAHIALTAMLAIADGGADSPMALGFFGTFTFTAYAMPLRLLPLFGSFNIAGYLLVYAVAGAVRPGFVPVELAGVLATGTACAQQHHRLAQQRRLLHQMACTDPLTGTLNRRGFDERLAELLAASGSRPTVLILDLDGFKEINDRRGHAAGDDLLVETAQVMREVLGRGVAIGRPGGDEFVAILSSLPTEPVLAELIATLEERISASVGAVTRDGPHQDARGLLEAADRELYRHKALRKQRKTPSEPTISGPVSGPDAVVAQ